MKAYLIADVEVTDPAGFEEYAKLAPAAIAAYGGKYTARGGRAEPLEGNWHPHRVVVVEFESVEKVRQWLESPEYAPAREMRHKTAITNSIVVEGL